MTTTNTTTETNTVVMTIDDMIQLQPATSGDGSIVPEGRYTLHLIRLEAAPPSTFKPEDGPRVKWVFNLYAELVENMDRGQLFEFNGGPYEFFRHTSTKNSPRAFARQYAEALMGRKMEDKEVPKLGPLVGSRMSAIISYDVDPDDATRQLLKMSGLKPVAAPAAPKPAPAPSAPTAAINDDGDRGLVVSTLKKRAARLKKLHAEHGQQALDAIAESDLDTAPVSELRSLSEAILAQIEAAEDDE